MRKLGHEEAGRMLMQWGVKKEVVDSMTNRCVHDTQHDQQVHA